MPVYASCGCGKPVAANRSSTKHPVRRHESSTGVACAANAFAVAIDAQCYLVVGQDGHLGYAQPDLAVTVRPG